MINLYVCRHIIYLIEIAAMNLFALTNLAVMNAKRDTVEEGSEQERKACDSTEKSYIVMKSNSLLSK